jgi:hypothetical protein
MLHFCGSKKGKAIPGKEFGAAVLFFFGGFDCLEVAVKHQVINNLESTRQKEGHVHEGCIRQQRSGEDGG